MGVSALGVSAPVGGVSAWGCVCLGECLLPGGVCSRGVSAPGGGLVPGGGVCSWGCIPACTEADTPPVDRILDTRF